MNNCKSIAMRTFSPLLALSVITGLTSSMALTKSAHAAPTAYPRPGHLLKQVKNGTTSAVLADSQNPRKLWVLPPAQGVASTHSYFPNTNVANREDSRGGYCGAIELVKLLSRNANQHLVGVNEQISKTQEKIRDLKDEASEVQEEIDICSSPRSAEEIDKAIEQAEDELVGLEEEFEALEAKLEACLEAGKRCRSEKRKLDRLEGQLDDIFDLLDVLDIEASCSGRLDFLIRKVASIRAKIASFEAREAEEKALFGRMQETIDEQKSTYLALSGGNLTLDFDSVWSANRDRIALDNPTFDVQKIDVSDVRVNAQLLPGQGLDAGMAGVGEILALSMAGKQIDLKTSTISFDKLPDRLQASANVSMILGCVLHDPDSYDVDKDKAGSPVVGLSVSYSYPSTFFTEATATYNMFQVYSIVRNSVSRGQGRCQTIEIDTLEDFFGESFIDVAFKSEQSNFPASEKERIVNQIKKDVVEDVIRQLGLPRAAQHHLEPETIDEILDGTEPILGIGDDSECALDLFCNRFEYLLRDPNLLKGNTSVSEDIQSSIDVEITRTYSEGTVLQRPGTILYSAE